MGRPASFATWSPAEAHSACCLPSTQGHLRYFHSPEELEPIATIDMASADVANVKRLRAGKYAFRVNALKQSDSHRKYILAGESIADTIDWIHAL